MIERVLVHPVPPPSPEQRLQIYQGVIRSVISDEELALKRMHGRAIQLGLFAGRRYEAEAIATATNVEPNYEH